MGQTQILLIILSFVLFSTFIANRFKAEETLQSVQTYNEMVRELKAISFDSQRYWNSAKDSTGAQRKTFVGLDGWFGSSRFDNGNCSIRIGSMTDSTALLIARSDVDSVQALVRKSTINFSAL
jgi:hypothetical protein